ncbi:MAG: NHL repeat-containing protein, partial [bacterium]
TVVDGSGILYFSEIAENRVRSIELSSGIIRTVAGTGAPGNSGDGGAGTSALLNGPTALALTPGGDLLIADINNRRIRRLSLTSGLITSFAGTGESGVAGDGGPALEATFQSIVDLAVSTGGDVYVADGAAGRIRKIDGTSNVVTTFAGGGAGADGGPAATAALSTLRGVAVDSTGNVFLTEAGNGARRVRRVGAQSGLISTVAGTGQVGSTGDGGPATQATFVSPGAISLDPAGRLVVADPSTMSLRRIDLTSGTIATLAGGDGTIPSGLANLERPTGLAFDGNGDLIFTELAGQRVRRYDRRTQLLTTLAGMGYEGYGGPGSLSAIANPGALAIDVDSNVYVVSEVWNQLRRIDASTGAAGIVAGNGTAASTGDGGPAISAGFAGVVGLALDVDGSLYVSESAANGGNRIRRIGDPVVASNRAPVTDAGPDLTVTTGTRVYLDGRRTSDPDGESFQAVWSQLAGPSVTITNATTLLARLDPSVPGEYEFALAASDGREGSRTDRVRVSVLAGEPLRLAYSRVESGKSRIWVMKPDGAGAQPVTDGSSSDTHPRWSPDRRKLAFVSDRSGQQRVWVMDAGGANPLQLEDDPDGSRSGLAWHPDGRRVLYSSATPGTGVRIVPADGSRSSTAFASVQGKSAGGLAFYPDGGKLLLALGAELYRVNADGSGLTVFIDRPGEIDLEPSVRPDGLKVMFRSGVSGQQELFQADALTGVVDRQLTANSGVIDEGARYSPDGSRVYFASPEGSDAELWSARPDFTDRVQLTVNALDEAVPDAGFPLGPNFAPSAAAGASTTGLQGHPVRLDGSGSWDPNGER